MEQKPFAIGVRVEHLQDMINKSQYGVDDCEGLPVAPYKLTYNTKSKRGVYSFVCVREDAWLTLLLKTNV